MRTFSSLPSGFCRKEADDIDHLKQTDQLCHHLAPVYHRSLRQQQTVTKTCAWSPDNSYFAWPSGGGKVELIPYDNLQDKIVYSENEVIENNTANDITIHLTKHAECHIERRPTRVLDGMENVWSVAFGSGSTKEDNALMWKRFKVDKGLLLATGHQNGKIRVWDCSTGKLLLLLKDHKDIVKSLDFAPDGSLNLVSGSRDGTIKFWDLNDDGNMRKSARANIKWVYAAKWSPKCDFVASVGSDKSVILWDMCKNYSPFHLHGHYHDVVGCCFSPDGALLATASCDTRVIIWDTCTGQSLKELCHMFPPPRPIYAAGANDFYIRGISFHPHGHMITTINDDGYVRCWVLEDEGEDPAFITEQQNAVYCAFSPKGHRISVESRSYAIIVVCSADGPLKKERKGLGESEKPFLSSIMFTCLDCRSRDKDGLVIFYQTPPKVARLQHLCRTAIRNCVKSPKVDFLHLPFRMKEYLKYHSYRQSS